MWDKRCLSARDACWGYFCTKLKSKLQEMLGVTFAQSCPTIFLVPWSSMGIFWFPWCIGEYLVANSGWLGPSHLAGNCDFGIDLAKGNKPVHRVHPWLKFFFSLLLMLPLQWSKLRSHGSATSRFRSVTWPSFAEDILRKVARSLACIAVQEDKGRHQALLEAQKIRRRTKTIGGGTG